MVRMSKAALLEQFVLSVTESGGFALVQPPNHHPFRIDLWVGENAYSVRLYIWNMSSGGPSSVRPEGEFRIQITGVSSPLLIEPGIQTLLLGWESQTQTFAAFDAHRHQTFGFSPSIQVRLTTLQRAASEGFAFQTRGNAETVVAFLPRQMVNYISQQHQLHGIGRSQFEENALANLLRPEPQSLEGFDQIPQERQTTITTLHRWARESTFRNRILQAYDHQCSVCRLQLQLVQAAHIIPVNAPGSNDLTSNGLALCPSDHAAYDRGLLGISPDYRIIVNDARLEELRRQNLSGGDDTILNHVSNSIVIPSQASDRPNPQYLQQGLQIRGWLDI